MYLRPTNKVSAFLIRLQSSRWFQPVMALVMIATALFTHQHGMVLLMGLVASTATIDGLLKDYYEDYVQEGVNNKNPMKDLIETKFMDKAFGGRQFMYSAHVERNVSPMFTAEYGLFAEAGVQGHLTVKGDVRKLMGRVLLTPEAMADSARSAMAWEDARTNEFDNLIKDLARRDEVAMIYDGRGILCLLNGDPGTGTTLTCDAPGGIAGADFGTRFLQKNIYVGAINPATGALRSGIRKITALASTGLTATIDSACDASWADNDYLVKAANSSVTDPLNTEYENAFWGLMALVDDGTYRADYFGIDRTLYDYANAYVNASTGALSIDLLQMLSDVQDQRMGGRTSLLLMHHSMRRVYIKLLEADRRYSGEKLVVPDGATVAFKQGDITVGEVPIKVIRDFPYGTIMGLDVEQMGLCQYVSEKGKWVDEDGRILVRSGTGATARDAFEGWYRIRKQYHAKLPSVCWRADGVTGATVVVVRPVGG